MLLELMPVQMIEMEQWMAVAAADWLLLAIAGPMRAEFDATC